MQIILSSSNSFVFSLQINDYCVTKLCNGFSLISMLLVSSLNYYDISLFPHVSWESAHTLRVLRAKNPIKLLCLVYENTSIALSYLLLLNSFIFSSFFFSLFLKKWILLFYVQIWFILDYNVCFLSVFFFNKIHVYAFHFHLMLWLISFILVWSQHKPVLTNMFYFICQQIHWHLTCLNEKRNFFL